MGGQAILVTLTEPRYFKFSACNCIYKEDSLSNNYNHEEAGYLTYLA